MRLTDAVNWVMIPILILLGAVAWRASGLAKTGRRGLLRGVKAAFSTPAGEGGLGGYETLMTSLAATVGTANVAGAAAALLIGGPGALVWMWLCGLLGMGIKYAEAVLSVGHARTAADGRRFGGMMYCIEDTFGRKGKSLAKLYCAAGLFSALATGALWQTAAAAEITARTLKAAGAGISGGRLCLAVGICGALAAAPVVFGGGKATVRAATAVVPVMCLGYIAATVTMITVNIENLPGALGDIFRGVLDPRAVTGGAVGGGAAFLATAAAGVQTGVFSSEAGLGSAGISYAAMDKRAGFAAGCCGMVEVFVDTMVLCSLTVLSIMCCISPDYGGTDGVAAVFESFSVTFGPVFAGVFLTASICLFALSSIFTWSWYGASCLGYMAPSRKAQRIYGLVFLAAMVWGAFCRTGQMGILVAVSNLFMVLPNGAAILRCRHETAVDGLLPRKRETNRHSCGGGAKPAV